MSKIDNLSPNATASEMEEAIKEHDVEKANPRPEPKTEEVKEVVEEKEVEAPKEPVTEKVETLTVPLAKEVVEDNFDYKKGYDGLRSWQTKMSQDIAEMKRVFEKPLERPSSEKQAEQQMTIEQLREWYDRDPIGSMAWLQKAQAAEMIKPMEQRLQGIQQELGGYKAQSVINKFREQYSDFKELEDDIKGEILKLPPQMQADPSLFDAVLDNSYWSVKGKKLSALDKKNQALVEERNKQEALRKAEAKKETVVEGGSRTTQDTPQDVSNMSSAEIFEILKAKGAVPAQN